MRKILFILLFAQCLFVSCLSMNGLSTADMHIRKVEIGMTKAEVISAMGDSYEIIASDGQNITLGYKSFYDNGIYKLRFENERLKEWVKEWMYDYDNSYSRRKNTDSQETTSMNKDNSSTRHHLDSHRNAMLSTATSDAQKTAINVHMDAHSKAVLGE